MRPITFLALSICALATTSCQTWDGLKEDVNNINTPAWASLSGSSDRVSADLLADNGNCPAMEVVEELGSINEYSDISDPQPYNLIARAHISQVRGSCEYNGKTATVDITAIFEGDRGPRAQDTLFAYPFFVAVTDPNGKIMAKEVFTADLAYGNSNAATGSEDIRQIIPIPNQNAGPEYKVLVGFQLSQDQLAYNRALIAERIAAEKAAAAAAKEAAKMAKEAEKSMMVKQSEDMIVIESPPYEPMAEQDTPIIIAPQ